MRLTFLTLVLVGGFTFASATLRATAGEPGTCPHDSKLLNVGPTRVFGDDDGTWWGLITDGLEAAGINTKDEQIEYLNHVFGTDFQSLEQLKDFNLQQVSDVWDANGNGYVCAYELRGTRAYLDDPLINLTYLGISDDKVSKKSK